MASAVRTCKGLDPQAPAARSQESVHGEAGPEPPMDQGSTRGLHPGRLCHGRLGRSPAAAQPWLHGLSVTLCALDTRFIVCFFSVIFCTSSMHRDRRDAPSSFCARSLLFMQLCCGVMLWWCCSASSGRWLFATLQHAAKPDHVSAQSWRLSHHLLQTVLKASPLICCTLWHTCVSPGRTYHFPVHPHTSQRPHRAGTHPIACTRWHTTS